MIPIQPQQPDERQYSDHDLLIVIAERTRTWGERFEKLEKRVTDLERNEDTQKGFFTGAKFLWGFLTALPVGMLAYLIGEYNQ